MGILEGKWSAQAVTFGEAADRQLGEMLKRFSHTDWVEPGNEHRKVARIIYMAQLLRCRHGRRALSFCLSCSLSPRK